MTPETYEALKEAIKSSNCNSQDLLKIYKEIHTERNLVIADQMIRWISDNWKSEFISLRDIVDANVCLLKTNASVQRIFYILEDLGYLHRQQRYMTMRGSIKQYWTIVKRKSTYDNSLTN
jgi:hypothetical protein